jgi:hypothetical protein
LEFIGMIFYITFFGGFFIMAIILIFAILGIIGTIKMVPEESLPILKKLLGYALILISLILLINI